ncbi:MAG: hypothetical protein ABWY12_03385 [Burkholderiales bacterium]
MKGKCVGAVICVALLAAAPATSFAAPPNEPSGDASCNGTLSVFNQTHPEVFGTRSSVSHGVIDESAATGTPPGEFFAFFAQVHGTAEQCL